MSDFTHDTPDEKAYLSTLIKYLQRKGGARDQ